MTPEALNHLQSWMCQKALELLGWPQRPVYECNRAMLATRKVYCRWWDGVFSPDPEEERLLDTAARAIAYGKPMPPLADAQRARLALRLRLGSRFARAICSRQPRIPRGWFPSKLSTMPQPELLEWLLVRAWPFAAELLDETLAWADETPWPPPPSESPLPPPDFGNN